MRMILPQLSAFLGQLPLRLAKTKLPFTLAEDEMTLHCEPLIRPIRLFLVGAGHVALATAHLVAYIGMIGSRRKRDAIYAALRREGLDDRDFLRVRCTVGLPLVGESPEEIALCIMAETQQRRYGKTV